MMPHSKKQQFIVMQRTKQGKQVCFVGVNSEVTMGALEQVARCGSGFECKMLYRAMCTSNLKPHDTQDFTHLRLAYLY